MSVTTTETASVAHSDIDTAELEIRHRAIAIAFYACMVVLSLQLALTALEVLWGGSQGGRLPAQVSLFSLLASIPWIANFIALLMRVSATNLAALRTETVFATSLIATFAGTYNLGFNVQIGAFGMYCGVIGTLRAGQFNGNIRVSCLLIAAMAALAARPGGLSGAELSSVTAVNDSLAWNLFAPFLQPYAMALVINFAIDFLMKSYHDNREQLMRAYADLADRWERDSLTGLFSRAALEKRFQQSAATEAGESSQLAVALIDLDNFKNINTFCGHGAGDKALCAFAERLQKLLPSSDLYRLGGDEFLAVQSVPEGDVPGLTSQLKAATRPMKIAYQRDELHLSASIGLTLVEGSCDYEKAASEADIAMRQAKRQGKGALVRFHPGDSVPSVSQLTRPAISVLPSTTTASKTEIPAREVGAAILSDQIGYVVQPFFDTTTQRISGAECLLRWRLKDGSIVPLNHYLNTFVTLEWQAPYMNHLLEKRQRLFSAIRSVTPINVHFNYTAEALKSSAFKSRVIEQLRRKPTDLRGFVIEISEKSSGPMGTIIDDGDLVVLRNSGVKIAIDDFGVGHSNLERIANVDADILKLDRQFVTDGASSQRGLEILRHVRQLTNSLGINLIAEGIETAKQESMLTDVGIREHQGFFRGRPKSPGEFLAKLQQQRFGEPIAF